MASRKVSKRGKYSRGKKYRARKTVRGHRRSTSGMIYPPLDVRSPHDLDGILKRITKGPITVVLVYADWCGHCHTLKPHFEKASNSPERNAQVISVRDDMLDKYNSTVNSKINSKAPQLNVEGYPSVLLVGPDGTKLSEIASTPQAVQSAMVNVAPVAIEAGLSGSNSSMNNAPMNNAPMNNARMNNARMNNAPMNNARMNNAPMNNARMNNAPMNNARMNNARMNNARMNNAPNRNALLKEIGAENRGLANKIPSNKAPNQSFEHLTTNRNVNRKNNNVVMNAVEVNNIGEQEEEEAEEEEEEEAEEEEEEEAKEEEVKNIGNDAGVATSLSIKPNSLRSMKLSTGNIPASTKNIPASAITSAITQRAADNLVSLQGVLNSSITPVSPPEPPRSIRNVEGANRIRGGAHGYGHGGSLYGMMSQTAYKLAPTAVLLATAAAVMNKTYHKRHGNKRSTKRSTKRKKRITK
jgi:thiol-disulfide isomerase/thioredoxin